jgi:2'-5' RNA ligase
MRLFFSAWPSTEAAEAVAALPRPEHDAIRWSAPANWHVTLLFLGEIAEAQVADLVDALDESAGRCPPRSVTLGPAVVSLGTGALVVPAAGVDDLAAAVSEAVRAAGIDAGEAARPFLGHLTVARPRGRQSVPPDLAGAPIHVTWTLEEITLVRSHLGAGGSSYEVLAARPLRGLT